MFNSKEYEWADVTVVMAGRVVTRIRGVRYKESLDKSLVYGKGNKPVAIQHGNYAYEGDITLLQSEVEALKAAAKASGQNLLEIHFNVVVSYGNPTKGDIMKTDVLKHVEFTEIEKALSQGDKNMEVTLPFIFLEKN